MKTIVKMVVKLGIGLFILWLITKSRSSENDELVEEPNKEIEKEIILQELKSIDMREKEIYALSCPFRSLFLTESIGGFEASSYPWLLQANSLSDENKEKLAKLIKRDFFITDNGTFWENIARFESEYEDIGRIFRDSTILYMFTSATDLGYITKEEMLQESEKYLFEFTSPEKFVEEFLIGLRESRINGWMGRTAIKEHCKYLINDELSPLNLFRE